MAFNVGHTDHEVKAKDLGASFIGSLFAYEPDDRSSQIYGRMAMVEVRDGKVRITMDGAMSDTGSLVLVLRDDESIYLPIMG